MRESIVEGRNWTAWKVIFAIFLIAWLCCNFASAQSYTVDGVSYPNVHPVKIYGTANSTIPVRWTIHNVTGTNTTTDLWLGSDINGTEWSNIVFAVEDTSTALPMMLTSKNETEAEIYVQTPVATNGTVINAFWNPSSLQNAKWSTFSNIKTVQTNVYYSHDVERFPFDAATGTYNTSTTVSYADDASSDVSARYATVAGTTIAFDTDHYNLVANTDSRYRLKSYQFKSGQYLYKFTLPASGSDGDYVTANFAAPSGDMSKRWGVGVIRKNGGWNVSTSTDGTITDSMTTISGLADGDVAYSKILWDSERGYYTGTVYEAADPGTPQVTRYNATYSYGYTGATVHSASGSKTFRLNSIEIRANCLIGESNIPATETGWDYTERFDVNTLGRRSDYSAYDYNASGYWQYNGGSLLYTSMMPSYSAGDGTYEYKFTEDWTGTYPSSNAFIQGLVFCNQNPTSETSVSSGNKYWLRLRAISSVWHLEFGKTVAGSADTIADVTVTGPAKNTLYNFKIVKNGSSIKIYYGSDAGGYPATPQIDATDTAFSSGYWGIYNQNPATGGVLRTYYQSFSGTRYYNAPMLRGAQLGYYWNGTAIVNATRYVDDFNRDTSAEYTAIGTAPTWDTTNGDISFNGANRGISPTGLTWDGQYASAKIAVSSTSNYAAITLLDDGNDGGSFASLTAGTKYILYRTSTTNLRLAKVVAGTATTLKDCTIPTVAANIINEAGIRRSAAGSFEIFWNGASVGTVTDTSITTPNPTKFGIAGFSSGTVKFYQIAISGLESSSYNGFEAMIGGVSHGARYDTNEYAGLSFAETTPNTYYRLSLPSKSTNTTYDASQNQLWFVDSSGNSWSNATAATNRAFTIGTGPTTRTTLGWDSENLQTTTAQNYFTTVNFTHWVGTQYDSRLGTVFVLPNLPTALYQTPATAIGSVWANFTANATSGNAPLPIQFTDQSVYDPAYPTVAWNWSFGDGNYSADQNPIHIYTLNGTHIVTLNASSSSGFDTKTRIAYIDVITSLPTSNFSANVTSGVYPLTVKFTDESTGIVESWLWDFGDGNTSTQQNPENTYIAPGNYSVNLTVANTGGSSYEKKTDYIWAKHQIPVANFTGTPTIGDAPMQVTFTDLSTNSPTNWLWDFGDGNTTGNTLQNPMHLYTAVGTFNVNLTAYNDGGSDYKYRSTYITTTLANPDPSALLQYKTGTSNSQINNQTAYVGTGTVRNITSGITYIVTNFTWNPTYVSVSNIRLNTSAVNIPGLVIDSSEIHNGYAIVNMSKATTFTAPANAMFDFNITYDKYAAPGTISVFGFDNSSRFYDTANATWWPFQYRNTANAVIGEWGPITTDFTADHTSVEIGNPITFTGTVAGYPNAYNWSFGDGNYSDLLAPPAYTYSATGIYDVSFTAYITENTTVSGTTTKLGYITILPHPPVAAFSGTPTSGVAPLTVTFTDTSTNSPTSYLWDFGDGDSTNSTVASPVHTYTAAGTYSVNLTVANAGGSDYELKADYILASPPVVADFTGTPLYGNKPLTVVFTDTSTGSPATWNWDFGDGDVTNATLRSPVHTYANTGTYTVSLQANNTFSTDTKTKNNYIDVLTPLDANFTYTPHYGSSPLLVTFTDTSTGSAITSYAWDFGDGNTSAIASPTHTYVSDGEYQTVLTITNIVGSSTKKQNVTVSGFTADFVGIPNTGNAPLSVTFTDTSSTALVVDSYYWSFGDGTTSAAKNPPAHTYTNHAYYTVEHSITNGSVTSWMNRTNYIDADGITANFTSDVTTGDYPLHVQFTDTSINTNSTPNAWIWDFGDGSTSTLQNPLHTYSIAGVYSVNFTVATERGSDSLVKTDYIHVGGVASNGRQDVILISSSNIITLYVKDASSGNLISSADIMDETGKSLTSYGNGVFTGEYSTGQHTFIANATNYYINRATYLVSSNLIQTIYLTQVATSVSTTWYTPKTIQIGFTDAYGNQLKGASVNAHYNESTLPNGVSDLISNYGMNSNVANEALNGTLLMSGSTDNSGNIVFTMLSTVKYDITVTYGGQTNYYSIYPQDSQYQFKFLTTVATDNIWDDLYANGNTKVWATEPDPSNVTFWWSFQDVTSLTTRIDFYLEDKDLNTMVYMTNVTLPTAGNIYQLNYTVPNVRGKNYMAWENYTRDI